MSEFERHRINPEQLIRDWWPDIDTAHIKYNPSMKAWDRDYWRVAQQATDGTLALTILGIQRTLRPLVEKTTYYNLTPKEDLARAVDIKYTIGDIWHTRVYGMVFDDKNRYGIRERFRIPVKCEYIYDN